MKSDEDEAFEQIEQAQGWRKRQIANKIQDDDTMCYRGEVIEEVASFPNGENDDFVDTTSQALLRFRQGGLIPLESDEKEEPTFFKRRRGGYYCGHGWKHRSSWADTN